MSTPEHDNQDQQAPRHEQPTDQSINVLPYEESAGEGLSVIRITVNAPPDIVYGKVLGILQNACKTPSGDEVRISAWVWSPDGQQTVIYVPGSTRHREANATAYKNSATTPEDTIKRLKTEIGNAQLSIHEEPVTMQTEPFAPSTQQMVAILGLREGYADRAIEHTAAEARSMLPSTVTAFEGIAVSCGIKPPNEERILVAFCENRQALLGIFNAGKQLGQEHIPTLNLPAKTMNTATLRPQS